MPLAIELAAARIRALSVAEIVDSLHDRFRLLTGGARTAVRRQQTLRASVDWSHAMLTEPERAFSPAGRVPWRIRPRRCAGDKWQRQCRALPGPRSAHPARRQIACGGRKTSGRTRYRLLETCASTRWKSSANQGKPTSSPRHRDHYTSMAASSTPGTAVRSSVSNRPKPRSTTCAQHSPGVAKTGDIELALRLASSLQPLWLTRGHVPEGLAWLEAALAQEAADHGDVRPARGRALADKTALLASLGVTESVDEAEQAVTIARELDDRALLVRVLLARGSIRADDSRVPAVFRRGGRPRARIGDSWRLAQILNWQSTAALQAGDMVATGAASEEVRELAESSVTGSSYVSPACGSLMHERTLVIFRSGRLIPRGRRRDDGGSQRACRCSAWWARAMRWPCRVKRTARERPPTRR